MSRIDFVAGGSPIGARARDSGRILAIGEIRLKGWAYAVVWHIAGLAVLSLFPLWKFGVPVRRLPQSYKPPCLALAAAYVLSAAIGALMGRNFGWRGLLLSFGSTLAIFGLVFLGVVVARDDFARSVPPATFVAALALIIAPRVIPPSAPIRLLSIGILIAPIAIDRMAPDLATRFSSRLEPIHASGFLKSAYCNLSLETTAARRRSCMAERSRGGRIAIS